MNSHHYAGVAQPGLERHNIGEAHMSLGDVEVRCSNLLTGTFSSLDLNKAIRTVHLCRDRITW